MLYYTLDELKGIFEGPVCGISVKRNFRKQYAVSGPVGRVQNKIHFSRINNLIFTEIK